MIVETTPSPAPPSLPPTPQFTVFPVQQPPVNRDALNAIVVEQVSIMAIFDLQNTDGHVHDR